MRALPRTIALAALPLLSGGCSLLLDLDGYRSDPPAVVPAAQVTRLLGYRFARGESSYPVSPDQGLLAGLEQKALAASNIASERGGNLAIADDGSFVYAPPGAAAAFWGDDAFALPVVPGRGLTRVRLTVEPRGLALGELKPALGTGANVIGPSFSSMLGSYSGHVAALGDVNGDALEDWGACAPGAPSLSAYVIFGSRSIAELSLDVLDDGNGPGFRIRAERAQDLFAGAAMAGAGDVNGDGLDDVIVGAPGLGEGFGGAYVVFGKLGSEPVDVAEIAAGSNAGFVIRGSQFASNQGLDAAGVGDVNGDGLSDLLVAGLSTDVDGVEDAGAAYVVWGKADAAPVDLAAIEGAQGGGFAILGNQAGAQLGAEVSPAGDVNGDGLADLIAGAWYASVGERREAGRAYVVYGKPDASAVRVADFEGGGSPLGFQILGAEDFDRAGATVLGAGDVNGDGRDDIAVAAPCASLGLGGPAQPAGLCAANFMPDAAPDPGLVPGTGLVYVAFGGQRTSELRLAELEAGSDAQGFVIVGAEPDDQTGVSLSAGDLDGDGRSDVVMGTSNRTRIGHTYVAFGKAGSEPLELAQVAAGGPGGLAISGVGMDASGVASASGADSNGDGLDDLLIAALFHPRASQFSGGAYLALSWDMTGALQQRDGVLLGTGAGEDFDLPALDLVKLRAGHGRDTLHWQKEGLLDLTRERARFESIEVIDLRGGAASTLALDDAAIRRLPEDGVAPPLARVLTALGDAADTLVVDLDGYALLEETDGTKLYARQGAHYGIAVGPALTVLSP